MPRASIFVREFKEARGFKDGWYYRLRPVAMPLTGCEDYAQLLDVLETLIGGDTEHQVPTRVVTHQLTLGLELVD